VDKVSNAWRKARYLLLSLVVLVLDQWTKWLVEVHLPEHVIQPVVPGFLNLTHVRNRGVAFGMFADGGDHTPLVLTLLALFALTLVGVYFVRAALHERMLLTSLALILGGAVGNLIDRIAAGEVTDFVDAYIGMHHWPAFNVADSAITVGIVLMLLDSVLAGRRSEAEEPTTSRAEAG
jgi:signal peptidase II